MAGKTESIAMASKADLHVHSKYSDRPSEWFLRRVGAPESFTEPIDVYRRAKARGMDYVTISDHNRIEGALEIAHLPGTFISCEVTTYFPEDGCKIHFLVCGIDEAQFRMIDELRTNIYELRRYVVDEDIIHSVAHPLFSVNHRLTAGHVEKLLLLFNRFEGINGARDPRASQLVNAIFRQLTPRMIEDMANRHGIEPLGDAPWKKCFTGGSDDHGGVYIANAYTLTPDAESLEQFLSHLRCGRHEMAGEHGTSLRLANSFYHIAYSYYRRRLLGDGRCGATSSILENLLNPRRTPEDETLRGRTRSFFTNLALRHRKRRLGATERLLLEEFQALAGQHSVSAFQQANRPGSEQRTFEIASRISHRLGYTFAQRFLEHLQRGDLINSLQTLASLGPVAMGVTPYIAAMSTQHKDERMLQTVAGHFEQAHHLQTRSEKRAWLTDTFRDVNGVTHTIRSLGAEAIACDRPLTVVTCTADQDHDNGQLRVRNFTPVGEFDTPEYNQQKLAFPPFLEVVEYLERERFGELIISTPGPMGLAGLAAGRLLGLRMTGIYHTDFERYVATLAQDEKLGALAGRAMQWFYAQMDRVLAPSETYRQHLIEMGIDPSRIQVMRRGVDTRRFNPSNRIAGYWQRHGLADRFTFIYAGRVSAEKNVDRLLETFRDLTARGVDAQLAIIGDGPQREALERKYGGGRVAFTGFLDGQAYAQALASADVMVFPSQTDTFGNVVLEAMASGLPAIVSTLGGPREIVELRGGGIVVDVDRPCELTHAMGRLIEDNSARQRHAGAALRTAADCTWRDMLEVLWEEPARSHAHALADDSTAPLRRWSMPPHDMVTDTAR